MKSAFIALAFVVSAPIAWATEIDVTYSDEMTEQFEDEYGVREEERLAQIVKDDLTRQLERRGLKPARIEITILDAQPSRPTFEQLSDRPGLNFGLSFGFGGMTLDAAAFDADGREIDRLRYDRYANALTDIVGPTVWFDASRASERFARKFAKRLAS